MNRSQHCVSSRLTNSIPAICLTLTAGLAAASPAIAPRTPASLDRAADPVRLDHQTTQARPAGYVYHNAATGERVVLTNETIPATARGAVWRWDNNIIDPCVPDTYPDDGFLTTAVFTGVHSEQAGDEEDPFAVRYWHDWLEHPGDSVISGFTITTFAQIVDVDLDGNGVGDGVEGLDLIIAFTENDDPDDSSNAVAHSPIIVESLPGSLDEGSLAGDVAGDGIIGFQEGQQVVMYIDLLGRPPQCVDFAPQNAAIEIGDTDGVPAVEGINFAGVPGSDTDGDGLINTGFIIGYRQPNVAEGDGLIARFPELAGLGLENPDGPNPDFSTFPNILPVGTPLTAPSDRTETYIDGEGMMQQWPAPGSSAFPGEGVGASDSMLLHDATGNEVDTFNFGGMGCDQAAQAANTPPFYVNPWSGWNISFNIDFIAGGDPSGRTCNSSDIAEPFGILDLADIVAFVTGFLDQDPIADFAPPECVFDLADIGAFVTAFQASCP